MADEDHRRRVAERSQMRKASGETKKKHSNSKQGPALSTNLTVRDLEPQFSPSKGHLWTNLRRPKYIKMSNLDRVPPTPGGGEGAAEAAEEEGDDVQIISLTLGSALLTGKE